MNYVSLYDSVRFTNWMNNGQGTGSTEDGAYTLSGNSGIITKSVGATVYLPSENEWYKGIRRPIVAVARNLLSVGVLPERAIGSDRRAGKRVCSLRDQSVGRPAWRGVRVTRLESRLTTVDPRLASSSRWCGRSVVRSTYSHDRPADLTLSISLLSPYPTCHEGNMCKC